VSQGRTVFVAGADGFVERGETGLFAHETRLLSRYRYLINRRLPQPNALSNVEQHSWLGYYIILPPGFTAGPPDEGSGQVQQVSQQTLELRLSRYVGEGVHEDVDLTNFTQQPTAFRLELDVDADFADLSEISGRRRQRGRISRRWVMAEDGVWELIFHYHAEHGGARLDRGIIVRVERADSEPAYWRGRLVFDVALGPRAGWHACVNLIPVLGGRPRSPMYRCRSFGGTTADFDKRRCAFLNQSTHLSAPSTGTLTTTVLDAIEQGKEDLAALRLYDFDRRDGAWTMAAGLPIYIALFGRDTLTAAWQAALLGPEMLRGTLAELARWQGRRTDDWRDEEPGRMLHEAHTGPLAILGVNPRRRYYGSLTTSGFYPFVVSQLWHWTGDKEVVGPLLAPACRALEWLDQYADRDRDGFYEYRTRSPHGTKNQGWKDSADAIVDEDGAQVEPPIATCEEQGFVYVAKLHMAEVLWHFGRRDEARRLFHQAGELKKRFNDTFWMDDLGFFAMGLDGQKRRIRSIGSHAGHSIATAIADTTLVRGTADRLMAPDLFSGWGIRTLSSAHPAYNPYSYHRGSVWPVENGTFALGFYRYGLHDHVERLCRAQFEAAARFNHCRLPELFSGHPRDADHPFPALYAQACWPQAWSASSVFTLLQAMLGLYPYAPLRALVVDPHLPAWLPQISVHGLRVGAAMVSLTFHRTTEGRTHFTIVEKRGRLRVLRQPSPWSLSAGVGERMRDLLAG
jgi:glycogen debranching enzyme